MSKWKTESWTGKLISLFILLSHAWCQSERLRAELEKSSVCSYCYHMFDVKVKDWELNWKSHQFVHTAITCLMSKWKTESWTGKIIGLFIAAITCLMSKWKTESWTGKIISLFILLSHVWCQSERLRAELEKSSVCSYCYHMFDVKVKDWELNWKNHQFVHTAITCLMSKWKTESWTGKIISLFIAANAITCLMSKWKTESWTGKIIGLFIAAITCLMSKWKTENWTGKIISLFILLSHVWCQSERLRVELEKSSVCS